MRKLLVLVVFILFLGLAITPCINANIFRINNSTNKQHPVSKTNLIDFPINVPPWNRGNSWTYDMNLAFEALNDDDDTTLKVNGNIPDMHNSWLLLEGSCRPAE